MPTKTSRPALPLSALSWWATGAYCILLTLNLGAMIVNIMAYTGAQSSDDRPIIKETWITFPSVGHHVQRMEIALPSLGLVMHITLPILLHQRLHHVQKPHTLAVAKTTQRWFILVPFLYHFLCLAAWSVLVVFQAQYVPVLGTNKLPECVEFGDELSQCGTVTASWILGIVMCALDLLMVIVYFLMIVRMTNLKTQQKAELRVIPPPAPSTQTQTRTRNSDPVRYHVVLPTNADIETASRPSYVTNDSPPPYSEKKAG